jgi:hypothetical protein
VSVSLIGRLSGLSSKSTTHVTLRDALATDHHLAAFRALTEARSMPDTNRNWGPEAEPSMVTSMVATVCDDFDQLVPCTSAT